jgi:ABC-2 type transport system permease protein
MRSRFTSLSITYAKTIFSVTLPQKSDLRNPKKLAKYFGIGLLALLVLSDFVFIFAMMNVSLYSALKPAGLQSLMLLNAATTAAMLVFVFGFITALSMFSMSPIESNLLSMPFAPKEFLGAKMVSVYLLELLFSVFMILVALIVYGINEKPPFMFYVNGLLTALALPLVPIALSYLILVPLMNSAKLFRSKNFILYVGGLVGVGVAMAFNFYIQSSLGKIHNPAAILASAGPKSFVSMAGSAWPPSWLAWKALDSSSSIMGLLAALANLALGAVIACAVAASLGSAYLRSIRAFSETSFARKKIGSDKLVSIFRSKPVFLELVEREFKLMNREPMYLLNGPFVIILLPVIFAITFIAQKNALAKLVADLGPLTKGPAAYLVPAALGTFLGSSTSIACTSVSRDAKLLPWIRSLPVTPTAYFAAKLVHALFFAAVGALFGSGIGAIILHLGAGDFFLSLALGLTAASALNLWGLWLDTKWPRLHWENPMAALKRNPNATTMILGTMALLGALGYLSVVMVLPRYGYALVYGGVFFAAFVAGFATYFRFARKRYLELE